MSSSRLRIDNRIAGDSLRFCRERRNLSQAEMAKVLSAGFPPEERITVNQIKNYEAGRSSMTASVLKRLAEVLDCSTDEIVNGVADAAKLGSRRSSRR